MAEVRGDEEVAAAEPAAEPEGPPLPQDFQALLQFVDDRKEIGLLGHLENSVRLVAYQPGRLEIALTESAPADFSQRLVNWLNKQTGARWGVIISNAEGEPTVAEQRRAAQALQRATDEDDPLVQEVKKYFPKAFVVSKAELDAGAIPPAPDDEENED